MTTQNSNQTITIRRMHIDDLDLIQQLYAEQESHNSDPITKIRINPRQHAWEMRRIRQKLLTEQRYLACVATIEDEVGHEKLIGYIAAIIEPQARIFAVETTASIGELWVLPDYRRRGIGKALTTELLDMINQLGIQWITVQLDFANEEVQAFFKNSGFTPAAIELRLQLSRDS